MDNTIRRINTITTGDFTEFEYLDGQQWKLGAISGTALHLLVNVGTTPQSEAVIRERVWRAALDYQPQGSRSCMMLTHDDFPGG